MQRKQEGSSRKCSIWLCSGPSGVLGVVYALALTAPGGERVIFRAKSNQALHTVE